MPETAENTQMATTYPTKQQYRRWGEMADKLDMSKSGFIAAMVEAGMKKFDESVEPDKTNQELREQRDDLKNELDNARERINKLEDRLYHSDSAEIRWFVSKNPGTDFNCLVEHLRATVPERADDHLTTMEGESVEVRGEKLYPTPETAQEMQQR
ncbi:hypothetical protein [Halopelagius fulvigenes]|uniref:Ribbon-helix-helix protein CopG domain-containing protein n=1 Tax=Halopelagius fulvigenes TaxID=1198324 RepID=A0ABD5U0V5_9EURY